jgi:integrase/recombinase XerD
MASVKILRDTRRMKDDGTYPIVLRLIHNRKMRDISLGYSANDDDWNEKEKQVKSSYPNSNRVNLFLDRKKTEAKRVIVDNEDHLDNLSVEELKELIVNFGKPSAQVAPVSVSASTKISNSVSSEQDQEQKKDDEKKNKSFFSYADEIIARLKKAKRFGSAAAYGCCVSSIRKYKNNEDLLLREIDLKFLMDYEADCLSKDLKINSIGNYMRSLRAIINLAIDEDYLTPNQYPFRKFTISKEKTIKRAIGKDKIATVFSVNLEEQSNLWHSRNYFTFMFCMRGMNFIDLAHLQMKDIINDRIIYTRKKTGKQYVVKINETARKILNHYTAGKKLGSEEYVFPIITKKFMDDPERVWKRVNDRRKYFNIDLKEIAAICDISTNLTSYVNRHSWASIAKFAGLSTSVIQEALGHEDSKTTETYLAEFEHPVLDAANELVENQVTALFPQTAA